MFTKKHEMYRKLSETEKLIADVVQEMSDTTPETDEKCALAQMQLLIRRAVNLYHKEERGC